MQRSAIFALLAFLAGCSTAGPFVTEVHQDGGTLTVKKCYVRFNPLGGLTGSIGNRNCTTEPVEPTPPASAHR